MAYKTMTDHQRVKAGNWIEEHRTWIETRPSGAEIARHAEKSLGFRVTVWFIRNYLSETEWWHQAQVPKVQPDPKADGDQLREAVAITIEAVEKMLERVHPSEAIEIRRSVQRAKSVVGTTSTPRPPKFEPLPDEMMQGGHA